MSKKISVVTYCSSCQRETNQDVLFHHIISEDEDEELLCSRGYMIIRCGGCKTISFLLRDFVYGEEDEDCEDRNYPNEDDYDFLNENDFDCLPRKIQTLYEEVEAAFLKDSSVLAGVGLRILVEAICIDRKITEKNLLKKITALHQRGLISSAELPILDKLRVIGNQSAHEIKQLPLDKLEYALGIINHILRSIYVLPKINKKLKL